MSTTSEDNDEQPLRPMQLNEAHYGTTYSNPEQRSYKRKLMVGGVIGLLVLIGLVLTVIFSVSSANAGNIGTAVKPNDQPNDNPTPTPTPTPTPNVNPLLRCPPKAVPKVTYENHTPVLIQGATVWDGMGNVMNNADILLSGGKIAQVGTGLTPPQGAVTYAANGRIVTPGIVDMHSHVGLDQFPGGAAHENTNEMSDPVAPFLRAADAFDGEDDGIQQILQGGVTTSQVIPGSGNLMGGQGMMIKMKKSSYNSDFLIKDAPMCLKMACGENPMRSYEEMGRAPKTRMGNGWLFRQAFSEALNLKNRQDAWCNLPLSDTSAKPTNIKLQPLVDLLRASEPHAQPVILNVHCYEVNDLQFMMDQMNTFGFNISAFHHVLEGWKIPDLLVKNNVGAATFSDLWGYKLEAYDGSTKGPKIMLDAGVKVAIKSDHPVLFAKEMMYEAAKTRYYGLTEQQALKTVTSTPAELIRLDHRVGSIQVGKDADVVVWDRNPMRINAKPERVYVEGKLMINNNLPLGDTSSIGTQPSMTVNPTTACTNSIQNKYVVDGATVYTMTDPNNKTPMTNTRIVVENGIITCMATGTTCAIPAGAPVYSVTGGVVTPGFIQTGTPLGQLQVDAEENTWDGYVGGAAADNANIKAKEGIRWLNKRHIAAAWKAAVTSSISHPMGDAVVGGQSVAFYTLGESNDITVDDVLVRESVALHLSIGVESRAGGKTQSISGQVSIITKLFDDALANVTSTSQPTFFKAATGKMITVIHANQADDCAAVAGLQQRYPMAKIVLMGGAEAYRSVRHLNMTSVPVIVTPPRAVPSYFFNARAVENGPQLLNDGGVTVALGPFNTETTRNLRWDAAMSGLQTWDAIASVTRNIAEMYGLSDTGLGRVKVGDKANFGLFTGSPLLLSAEPRLVAVGRRVECNPVQF